VFVTSVVFKDLILLCGPFRNFVISSSSGNVVYQVLVVRNLGKKNIMGETFYLKVKMRADNNNS
jgi:hypothetical protein